MYERKQAGIPRNELSDDETLTRTFVGNVFRELDGGSERFRELVVKVGDQTHEEICCKCCLHPLFPISIPHNHYVAVSPSAQIPYCFIFNCNSDTSSPCLPGWC
jgi:hypothetical protein